MIKRVSFSNDTKEEREIIPGKILGIIVDMDINGIFLDRIPFRNSIDLFNSLKDEGVKVEIFKLFHILIKNMQAIAKENNTTECDIKIPVCMSGSCSNFVSIYQLSNCLRLFEKIELTNSNFAKIKRKINKF